MTPAPRPVLRLLRRYAWRYRWSYLAGALFLALTNYLTVSIPGQIGGAVDALQAGGAVGRYARNIALMGLAVMAVRTLSRILIFNPARDLEYRLRQDLFAHLMRLQPSFYARHKAGDIVSRAANDVSLVRALVGFGGLQACNVVLALILAGWKMAGLSPLLTGFALGPVLAAMGAVYLGVGRLFALQRRNQQELAEISDHVLGTFRGIEAVQGFGAEAAFLARLDERNDAWFRTGVRLALVRSLVIPLLVLGGGVSVFGFIAVGGPMTIRGEISVGDLAAFAALVAALLPPLRSVGWMLAVVQRGRAALERLFELLDAPVDRPEGEDPVVLPAGRGPAFSLRGLTFAYPQRPDRPVLRDIRAEIPAGATVGLFGRTGSGKTTLLRLLARLYNPPPGTIAVDGADLPSVDLDAWRDRLAVVPQQAFLFSETIEHNVALEEVPDRERVRRAVDLAALGADLTALPRGVETVVGERGIMLSGGQRQRTALARGLYRGGDVLILDDVLSAVDHRTEARLVETLGRLAREGRRTTFIASHRLSAIRGADLILVLEDGRLADAGTHEELVSRPGVYRETWEAQAPEEAR